MVDQEKPFEGPPEWIKEGNGKIAARREFVQFLKEHFDDYRIANMLNQLTNEDGEIILFEEKPQSPLPGTSRVQQLLQRLRFKRT